MSTSTLEEILEFIRTEGPKFREEHGSVEVMVPLTSPLALAKIQCVDGIKIDWDDWKLRDHKTGQSRKPGPSVVHFHCDDHPMWGSKAEEEDDSWLDNDGDVES